MHCVYVLDTFSYKKSTGCERIIHSKKRVTASSSSCFHCVESSFLPLHPPRTFLSLFFAIRNVGFGANSHHHHHLFHPPRFLPEAEVASTTKMLLISNLSLSSPLLSFPSSPSLWTFQPPPAFLSQGQEIAREILSACKWYLFSPLSPPPSFSLSSRLLFHQPTRHRQSPETQAIHPLLF